MKTSRRDFLKLGAMLSLAASAPRLLMRSALAAPPDKDKTILVVLQLSGGNDGLNTVIPFVDDVYHKSRPTLRQVATKAHHISDQLAFHPRMEGFAKLFGEGQLAVVQGVGCAKSDRNHPGAMHMWHTADQQPPGPPTGWLGRAADQLWNPAAANLPAAFVGAILQPFAANSERVIIPSIRSARDLVCPSEEKTAANQGSTLLDFSRRATTAAQANSRRLEAVLRAGAGDYPQYRLADELRTIAQLIRADTGIRLYFAELGGGGIGGFDNHAGQLGNHCSLLEQLSTSITAFARDLQRDKLLDRVALMTFSEFGRTVHENGRHGTNHGAAQPIFVIGGAVKGGLVGAHPNLIDLDQDGQKIHTDFRRVYATLLDRWLGLDSRAILGAAYPPVDFLRA
jgi:uncharacterized protein (DUF1501 family)